MQIITCRLLPAAVLGWVALSWLEGGTASLPRWLANLGARASLDDTGSMRLALGAIGALAFLSLLLGSRPRVGPTLARITGGVLAFCAVASLSGAIAVPIRDGAPAPPLAPGLWALGAGFALFLLGDRAAARQAARRKADDAAGIVRRSPSPAWTAILAITATVASFALASRANVIRSVAGVPGSAAGQRAPGTFVEFDYTVWAGKTIPDTGLARHAPMLTALTLEGRTAVVFYDPRCGSCHALFRDFFAVPHGDEKVVAVKVPPDPDAQLLPSDQPEQVECAGCTHLEFPAGVAYLIAKPTLMVVQDGRVVCATERDFAGCLGRAPESTLAPAADGHDHGAGAPPPAHGSPAQPAAPGS